MKLGLTLKNVLGLDFTKDSNRDLGLALRSFVLSDPYWSQQLEAYGATFSFEEPQYDPDLQVSIDLSSN